jgi:hypothetical protein
MVHIHFWIGPHRGRNTEEHARAGLLAEELAEARGRIVDEKQRLGDLQMANEELQRRLAEEHLHGNEVCLERSRQAETADWHIEKNRTTKAISGQCANWKASGRLN